MVSGLIYIEYLDGIACACSIPAACPFNVLCLHRGKHSINALQIRCGDIVYWFQHHPEIIFDHVGILLFLYGIVFSMLGK